MTMIADRDALAQPARLRRPEYCPYPQCRPNECPARRMARRLKNAGAPQGAAVHHRASVTDTAR